MPRSRPLRGRSHRIEPDWQPLIDLVGLELVDRFMWMCPVLLEDGTMVYAYKHRTTRRYFHLGVDGRTFEYDQSDRYREIGLAAAVREAFWEWEQLLFGPGDAELAALEELKRRVGIATATADSDQSLDRT